MNIDRLPRVVITGFGAISPLGNDSSELYAALCSKTSGVRPLTQIDVESLPIKHGAEATCFTGKISDYGPLEKALQRTIRKGSKVMCREIEMGVAAAQLAIVDSGLSSDQRDPMRTGAIYGCDYIMTLPEEFSAGIGRCIEGSGEFDFRDWAVHGLPQVNPLWLLKYLPNMPASHVAIYNDLRGPNNSITLREASPLAALAEAYSTIQRGHADAIIVGATGSRVHPFRTMQTVLQEELAADRNDPSTMSRPFDRDRNGSVVGEGAGALVIESLVHAEQRGATIRGEIIGYGSSAVGPPGKPGAQRKAIGNVLRGAMRNLDMADVGHIHAHGLATVAGDIEEAQAISDVFGNDNRTPPVVAAKGHFGNLGAGGGMVELIASLCAIEAGKLFPTLNHETCDPNCPIRVVTDTETDAGDSFVTVNVTPQGQAAAIAISNPR